MEGITQGFRIGHCPSLAPLKSAKKNMQSALCHEQVIDDYLSNEEQDQRVVGPFATFDPSLADAHINRFGVIPKSHQPDKWRLIVDLSHPKEASVNDGIIRQLCSMSYTTVDEATQKVASLGPGSLLAKIDIKRAFRLIPVHPADRHLLAMRWRDGIYIDTCLPFGLRSAPKLFNILADLLEWILLNQGISFVMHYLDDYLTIGPPNSPMCYQNLQLLIEICGMLVGIPLATHKIEGPATELEFLGILIDTVHMEVRLPDEKLTRTRATVGEFLHRKNATKREILSIVGVLQHAAKVVRPGRSFVGRMYCTAAKVTEMDYFTRLNVEFQSDLYWWHLFLSQWNGVSFLPHNSDPTLTIQTDASGHWGCGGFADGMWFQLQWSPEWLTQSIMPKELVPIVISCAVWGPVLARRRVKFQCDNTGVVKAVEKGYSKEQLVMKLLRSLWFFVAHFDITIHIEHIAGAQNTTADCLSRNKMHQFFSSNTQADRLPTPLPLELIQIVAVTAPDWTSPLFRQLFNTTTRRV